MRTISIVSLLLMIISCREHNKLRHYDHTFQLGKVSIAQRQKQVEGGLEIAVFSRYQLEKALDEETSTYFQYQLGRRMKMVVGEDTIQPSLFYYVPLLSEKEKEIDCRYLISNENASQPKRLIIDDSLFQFNKVSIAIQ
jgi:hypothetical protein